MASEDVERGGDLGELLAQRGDRAVQLVDLGARLIALLNQLAQPDVAGVDFLLRQRGALLGRGQLRLQLLRAVAQRSSLLLRRGEPGHLLFEIGAHGLQRLDVAPQALEFAQLQVDLFLVGADDGVGVAQFAAQLVGAGRLLPGLRGQLGELCRQRCRARRCWP